MKTLILLVTAQLALATGSLHAQSAHEEFLRLEQEWTDALARRDSVRLEQLLSPHFTITGVASTVADPMVGRARYLRNAVRFAWPRREIRVLDVHLFSDVAVVRCIWRGTDPPAFRTPEPETGIYEFLITDVWVRSGDDWQVLARHASLPPGPK